MPSTFVDDPRAALRALLLEDANRDYADALRHGAVDRLVVGTLWAHFVAIVGLVLAIRFLGLADAGNALLPWRPLGAASSTVVLTLAYAAAALPVLIRRLARNHFAWRAAATAGLTLYSALLIFVTGGAIEAHFHLFLVIGVTTLYSDWRLPWLQVALVVAHHVLLDLVEPTWVFAYGRSDGAVLVHAGAEVLAASFATLVCVSHRSSIVAQDHARRRVLVEKSEKEDVAAALEAERERLRTMVEHMPAGVILAVPHGARDDADAAFRYRIIVANQEIGRILRCRFRIGGTLAQYRAFAGFHPDGRPYEAAEWPLARSLARGEVVENEEIEVQRGDGTRGTIAVHSAPIRTPAGVSVGAVMIVTDATARRAAERELEESRRRIAMGEQLARLGTLVAGVAHEVRTPLTYIANNLFLIRQRIEREVAERPDLEGLLRDVGRHQGEADEGVDRISRLVQNLRQTTKLEPGQRVRLGFDEAIEGAVELFRATQRHRVRLEADLQPTPAVEVDRTQVQQVALNLLLNAAEAMPGGGVVRVATRPAPGGAVLVVEDQGGGIPPELRVRLFDPFFTTKAEGMGLGLPISKRLVEAHGGTIRFDTVLAQGTTFTVFLPSADAAAATPQPPAPRLRPSHRMPDAEATRLPVD